MISRHRLVAGSAITLGALALFATPAAAETCPTTLLPGEVCTAVDTVVGTLVPATEPAPEPTTDTTSPPTTSPPTTVAPEPVPALPVPELSLLPEEPTSPLPSPAPSPSDGDAAPAPSTSPGTRDASPASYPAAPISSPAGASAPAGGASRPSFSPVANETARGFDLPGIASTDSPFTLGPAPVPTATNAGGTAELAASSGLPSRDGGGASLPRPNGPITLAVLLVAGVLGAHGVRWIDRQTAAIGAPAKR